MTFLERLRRNSVCDAYMLVLESIDATIDPIYYPALRALFVENTHDNGVYTSIIKMGEHELHAYALRRLLDTHARLQRSN